MVAHRRSAPFRHARRVLTVLLAVAVAVSMTGLTVRSAIAAIDAAAPASATIHASAATDCDDDGHHNGDRAQDGSCCKMSCHAVVLAPAAAVRPIVAKHQPVAATFALAPGRPFPIDRPPRLSA